MCHYKNYIIIYNVVIFQRLKWLITGNEGPLKTVKKMSGLCQERYLLSPLVKKERRLVTMTK
jgi:hypothetical protein